MSSEKIHITVNGEEKSVSAGTGLVTVLRELDIDPATSKGVAVAVNLAIVRRQNWVDRKLASGDSVEIVTAFQGG